MLPKPGLEKSWAVSVFITSLEGCTESLDTYFTLTSTAMPGTTSLWCGAQMPVTVMLLAAAFPGSLSSGAFARVLRQTHSRVLLRSLSVTRCEACQLVPC